LSKCIVGITDGYVAGLWVRNTGGDGRECLERTRIKIWRKKMAVAEMTWIAGLKLVWSSLLAPIRMRGGSPDSCLRLSRVLKKNWFLNVVPTQSVQLVQWRRKQVKV
jgi:hypothetical protein